jgi:predicted Zn-dependent protease with MMP-like domain
MKIEYAVYYLEHAKRLELSSTRKIEETKHDFEAGTIAEAVQRLSTLMEDAKKTLPKLANHSTYNCVVLETKKPLPGMNQPFQLVHDLNANFEPRQLSEICVADKVKIFDSIYAYAKNMWDQQKAGEFDEDNKQWCFEKVMNVLEHPGQHREFWNAWNSMG